MCGLRASQKSSHDELWVKRKALSVEVSCDSCESCRKHSMGWHLLGTWNQQYLTLPVAREEYQQELLPHHRNQKETQ